MYRVNSMPIAYANILSIINMVSERGFEMF